MTRSYTVYSRSSDHTTARRGGSPFRSLLSFTIVFAVGSLFCQALRGYVVSQITALEKQFGLSSIRSGLLVGSEDIGYVVAILFVGHFGRHGHIPRILATTMVLLGCTGTLSGVSYFFNPVTLPSGDDVVHNVSVTELCVTGSSPAKVSCRENGGMSGKVKGSIWVFGFLIALGILQGGGQSARYTLGAPYIEDNAITKSQSTLFNGIVLAVDYLGTPLALALGGVVSSIPLDLKETTLYPEHPQWIGAWWLGYLVLGCLVLLTLIPLFFCPRAMPHPQRHGPSDSQLQDKTDMSFKEKLIGTIDPHFI